MADTARAPADRLQACLQVLLAAIGTGAAARETWATLHDAYVAAPVAEDAAQTFLAMERVALGRVERWLSVLEEEGTLPAGHREASARFLLSIVNGLALERAFPGAQARLAFEGASLRLAVAAVLG